MVQPGGNPADGNTLTEFLKDQRDERCGGFLRLEFCVSHPVPEGRDGNCLAPGKFLIHSPADFLREIQGIIFIHRFQQGFYKDGGGIVGERFGNGDHFNAAFPAEHGFVEDTVLAVSGEAGEFPYEDHLERSRVAAGGSNHAHKCRAFAGGTSADPFIEIDLVFGDCDLMLIGILLNLFQLAVGRKFQLVFCGHTDVGGACHKKPPGKAIIWYRLWQGTGTYSLKGAWNGGKRSDE